MAYQKPTGTREWKGRPSQDPPSRRRNPEAIVGFVNFPTKSRPSTGEGGMFVRLVVIDTMDDANFYSRYTPCCGGYQSFVMDESFVGDDLFDHPEPEVDANYGKWYEEEYLPAYKAMEERYFPNLYKTEEEEDTLKRYTSREFLAVMTIGATGWSDGTWACSQSDLTPEGVELLATLAKLYPGCEIRLLTFLDT